MILFGDENETELVERLTQAGVRVGVLKRGALGPRVFGSNGDSICNFEAITNVVDSTAAGDSFNAGFLSEYACGKTIDQAAKKGHQIASKVIQKKGAIVTL